MVTVAVLLGAPATAVARSRGKVNITDSGPSNKRRSTGGDVYQPAWLPIGYRHAST